jgi:hypothetical protein
VIRTGRSQSEKDRGRKEKDEKQAVILKDPMCKSYTHRGSEKSLGKNDLAKVMEALPKA